MNLFGLIIFGFLLLEIWTEDEQQQAEKRGPKQMHFTGNLQHQAASLRLENRYQSFRCAIQIKRHATIL